MPNVPIDKQAHAWAGCAICSLVLLLTFSLLTAVLVTVFVGWAWEYLYNARRPESHTVDPMDMLATWAGCVPVVAVLVAKRYFFGV